MVAVCSNFVFLLLLGRCCFKYVFGSAFGLRLVSFLKQVNMAKKCNNHRPASDTKRKVTVVDPDGVQGVT